MYDAQRREWVEATYDPTTDKYYSADDRCLGTGRSKYSNGTAIRRSEAEYDPITNKYYIDDIAVADGPED